MKAHLPEVIPLVTRLLHFHSHCAQHKNHLVYSDKQVVPKIYNKCTCSTFRFENNIARLYVKTVFIVRSFTVQQIKVNIIYNRYLLLRLY